MKHPVQQRAHGLQPSCLFIRSKETWRFKTAAAILCSLFFTSCSLFHEKEKPVEKKTSPNVSRLIGRVASMPMDKRFVLVQTYEPSSFEAGAILTTRGDGERTANLKVTGEKLGQFLAADIQAGEIEVGDGVFSLPVLQPNAEEKTSPAPTEGGPRTPSKTTEDSKNQTIISH